MWPTDAGRWNSFDDPQRQDVMPTGNTDWLKTYLVIALPTSIH